MSHKIRAHNKSRQGCKNCKLRRVKCDETKPQCGYCSRHRNECIYLPTKREIKSTTAHVSPSLSTEDSERQTEFVPEGSSYTAKHLLDLRLMHHYCVFTTEYFTSAHPEAVSASLRLDVPQLAFQHEFLMDAVLLVAMVHLRCSRPAELDGLPVCAYRDKALSGLRRAVSYISPQIMNAVLGASVLLATVSFAADRVTGSPGLWVMNWLILAMGQRNFRCPRKSPTSIPSLEDGQLLLSQYGSFADVDASPAIPTGILNALADWQENIDSSERDMLRYAAGELGRLISVLQYPHEQSWLEKKIKAWAFDVVPPEFLTMTREERPHALVVLAHYLILFRLLPDVWVYEGLAYHDIEIISQTLGHEWEKYIATPKAAIQAEDRFAIIAMLVGSLGDTE